MKRIDIIKEKYQQFRVACLESVDEDIEICYNNNILIHNFDYSSKINKVYNHHTTRHGGAMTEIESEVFDIYQMMVKGGVPTRVGEREIFVVENNLNIQYAEGDNMIGLTNLTAKVNARQLYTTTYYLECGECGHKGFTSVKKEMMPKCPKCAGKAHVAPQIPMADLVDASSLINREPEKKKELTFFNENKENGFNVKLILDNAQAETLQQVQGGVLLGEGIKRLYGLENKAIDANKKESPRPISPVVAPASKPKKATTTKSRSKITDDDLNFVLQQIRTHFTGKSFKSRDLAPKVADKLTARQLPSRLTQLVNKGILDADSSSPKNYTIKGA